MHHPAHVVEQRVHVTRRRDHSDDQQQENDQAERTQGRRIDPTMSPQASCSCTCGLLEMGFLEPVLPLLLRRQGFAHGSNQQVLDEIIVRVHHAS